MAADLVMLAQEATALKGGLFLTKAYQSVPASVYPNILEQVRNRLFDFLLNLQNNNPTLDASNESEAVGKLVNYHIYGGHNVTATGEQVNQQISIVHQGDAVSLLDNPRGEGVEEEDLQELRNAVVSEPEAVDGNYGPQVGAWLGGMMAKGHRRLERRCGSCASDIDKGINEFYGI